MKLLITLGLCLALPAVAAERAPYSAQATLQRAQVGTYSARAAAPVKVQMQVKPTSRGRRPQQADFNRLRCFANPAEPKTIICEPGRSP